MLKHAVVVYCDFECLTETVSNAMQSTDTSFSTVTQIHKPICYAMIVLDKNERIIYSKFYCGLNAVEDFLSRLKALSEHLIKEIKLNIPLDPQTIPNSINRDKCYICGRKFSSNDVSVIDHNHLNGQFRGVACRGCNLNLNLKPFIPVVLHNFSGYDSHLILKDITKKYISSLSIVPINMEKYTTYSLDCFKFLDSYQFLNASLNKLTDNLVQSKYDFPIFKQFFSDNKNSYLLKRKGVFPYSWFNNISKLNNTSLPDKKYFYNDLTRSHISSEDYDLARLVWKAFNCKKFSDYLQLYQFVDTILLADIFTNFRNLSLKYYDLDPLHFLTSPHLTFTAGLKMAKIELQLFTDLDMYLFVESGLRGGLSLVSKRFSRANNPYVSQTYDKSKPHSYIVMIDSNNLYGLSMVQYLPYGEFRWLRRTEIDEFDIKNVPLKSEIGYILEVDLEYPVSLHNRHNDFPLAVNHEKIEYEDLSEYQKSLLSSLNLKFSNNIKKLVSDFKR
ncbi:uncharacterized protein [Centruroides vittatus]|uniref:uncharacterized protein n=1 Tax=Centruroides vittatus TaxID=120091 RepID=UPI0035104D0F